MVFRQNKKGASRVTSEMLMKVGEYLLPILAFIVVLYIVISVGSARSAQTYYQVVEFTNIMSALSTFDGFATLRYIPIKDDFTFNVSDSVVHVNTKDGKAPNSRILRVPTYLEFVNLESGPNVNSELGQVRFTKTESALRLDSINSADIKIRFGELNKPDIYGCGDKQNAPAQPVYIDMSSTTTAASQTHSSQTFANLRTLIQAKKIQDTFVKTQAGLIIYISFKPSNFNSVVVFSDSTVRAAAFVCAFANDIMSLDEIETQTSTGKESLDSVVVVPAKNVPFTQEVWGEPAQTPKLFIEISYNQVDGAASRESSYNAALARAIRAGYEQVFS